MIEELAGRMATRIKKTVPEHPASTAVLQYSLSLILNAGFIIVLSLGIGVTTGKLVEIMLVLGSFALLRQLSGGIHLKSGMWCVAATSAGATILSFVEMSDKLTFTVTAITVVVAAIWAPTNIEKQSRIPRKYYPALKVASVMLVSLNFLIGSDVISLAFAAQGLTLILGREVKKP